MQKISGIIRITIIFDERFKVTLLQFFIPDINL